MTQASQNQFHWCKYWGGSAKGQGLERRLFREPNVEAKVYMNAHDNKSWVANIESNEHGGFWCDSWKFVDRIRFGFATRAQAMRWVVRELPAIRAEIRKYRKAKVKAGASV